jgi:hypothetical protein
VASLKHQVQYYQEAEGISKLKKYLMKEHDNLLKVQDELVMNVPALQEESLFLRIPYKEVLRWAEKGTRALDRIEFLK